MRLDILFFLGFDIDEPLPWHSIVSRTRQLFPEAVFTQVLKMCIEKGMVSGHIQAIDSVPVKANASMDSLELKVPAEELAEHLKRKRQSTVEPYFDKLSTTVFGTLTQFLGLRKINTIGIQQAIKVMHMAAIAYNLKKYLKFTQKRVKSGVKNLSVLFFEIVNLLHLNKSNLRASNFTIDQ